MSLRGGQAKPDRRGNPLPPAIGFCDKGIPTSRRNDAPRNDNEYENCINRHLPEGKLYGRSLNQTNVGNDQTALSLPPSRHIVPTHLPRQREAFPPYNKGSGGSKPPPYNNHISFSEKIGDRHWACPLFIGIIGVISIHAINQPALCCLLSSPVTGIIPAGNVVDLADTVGDGEIRSLVPLVVPVVGSGGTVHAAEDN